MAMRTVNSQDAYDKDKFVDAMEDLSKLELISQTAETPEGHWNPDLRRELGNLARENQTFYAGLTPDHVMGDSQRIYSQYRNKMGSYVKNKVDSLIDKINGENLISLVKQLPFVRTGNREYDKIKRLVDEKRKIAEAKEKGAIENYVNEKMMRASDWRKESYYGYSMGDPTYVMRTFNAYEMDNQADFIKATHTEERNIREKKLRGLIKANYEKIKSEKGEDHVLAKVYCSAIAKAAHESIARQANRNAA